MAADAYCVDLHITWPALYDLGTGASVRPMWQAGRAFLLDVVASPDWAAAVDASCMASKCMLLLLALTRAAPFCMYGCVYICIYTKYKHNIYILFIPYLLICASKYMNRISILIALTSSSQ
jgi:hypothetical protein